MHLALLLVILSITTLELTRGAPAGQGHGQGHGHKPQHKQLDDDARQKLRASCKKHPTGCKGNTPEQNKQREMVKSGLIKEYKNLHRGASDREAEQHVEARMQRIHKIKKQHHHEVGLDDIEPVDNGLMHGHILVSEDDLQQMEQVKQAGGGGRRKRLASIFFEQEFWKKYPLPIHYYIDQWFKDNAPQAATLIRAGLQDITDAVPCIQFIEENTQQSDPVGHPQIQYLASGSSACGANSYVGFRGGTHFSNPGFNTIQVSPPPDSCISSGFFRGMITHESLHSLGFDHEQSREDRDNYVDVLWDNIDPNMYTDMNTTNFNGGPTNPGRNTSVYGVPYDYQSVMHYANATALKPALQDPNNNALWTFDPDTRVGTPIAGTMVAKKPGVTSFSQQPAPKLTKNDITVLKRTYCVDPNTCKDTYVDCGTDVLAAGGDCSSNTDLQTNCPHSCGSCTVLSVAPPTFVTATQAPIIVSSDDASS